MKVRTFTGSETVKVDKRVNDWLAKFGIKPHHTNTAIGQFTVKGEDQLRASRRTAKWRLLPFPSGMRSRRNKGNSHVVRNRIWSASKVPYTQPSEYAAAPNACAQVFERRLASERIRLRLAAEQGVPPDSTWPSHNRSGHRRR